MLREIVTLAQRRGQGGALGAKPPQIRNLAPPQICQS